MAETEVGGTANKVTLLNRAVAHTNGRNLTGEPINSREKEQGARVIMLL